MKYRARGFTLIELMVAITIIAIMSAAMFRMMRVAGAKNAIAATARNVQGVMFLVESYRSLYGSYPPALGGGYAPVGFIVTQDQGRGNAAGDENTWVRFGLFSNFVPRATELNRADADVRAVYREGVKNADGGFEGSFSQSTENVDLLLRYVGREANDINILSLNRQVDLLVKDGIVTKGVFVNPETDHSWFECTSKDAWKKELYYSVSGGSVCVFSAGPDGDPDTQKDNIYSYGR